ncbi:hypothetical protein CEN48_09240 [Fischerella thermalis CCMEE 5282]|uniref:GMC oxidoreductase n=1 Tax=Fischerella thermalis TaxID=372787 RepID=UPI000C80D9CC|nr:GMC oxidoreductase [Fischerella thermalis]PMB14708.1 hypothetical protein CEN48_09240 [Fischerella thermalis CCMEE 5282]
MYDYVIIGGSSAGCVLAHRLTENPKTTVLLLEAGNPDQKPEIHIPAGFPKLLKTEYDWAYYTEKQPFLNNRQLYWPRGKVIGGSSSINAMIYIRGNLSDYDYWHNLGNSGWSAKDVLPYFIKADLEVLVAGVKLSRQLAQMPAFDSFRGEEFVPGVGVQDDEEIRTYIRDTVESLYHPVGTCKMGNDSMAVVNSQLQVHGVQGLRVIDASIMPSITGGNTNAPTIMIAEKAADMIKNY